MNAQHWTVVVVFLTGLGMALTGLDSWADANHPVFLGGVLLQVVSVVRSLYLDKMGPPK